jgi:mannosyltransferase OCH1-like enzyme
LNVGVAIPRILHVTSSRVPLVGVEKSLFRANRRKLGHSWKYRTWSDSDNDDAIAEYFPEVLDEYRHLQHGVMRADIARLAYMHIEGGWYADTDYEWLADPTEAASAYEIVLPLSRDGRDGGDELLGNAVFGSVKGHPFWSFVLRTTLAAGIPRVVPVMEIEQVTGPGLLTRHRARAHGYAAAWLPQRELFHPPVRGGGPSRAQPFGIHHTRGSWRSNSLQWRLRMEWNRLLTRVPIPRN